MRRLLRAGLIRATLVGGMTCPLACGGPAARDAKIVAPAPSPAGAAPADSPHHVAATASRRFVVVPERSRVLILAGSVLGEHPVQVAEYQGDADVVEPTLHHSRVRVTLKLDSVEATSPTLTKLIKSERVLDVQRYPTASFASERIVPQGASQQSYRLIGTLTLHGISKTVEVVGRVCREGTAFVASSRFSLRRQEFGIKPGGLLGLLINDNVVVDLRLVAEPTSAP